MAITRAQIARQLLMEGGLLRKNFQTGDLAARDDSYGTVSAPDAVTGGGNDYYDQRFQEVVSPPQSETGRGPYDDNETILSNILGGIGGRVDRVSDRIKGFGTRTKNYLSDPSNQRGILANIALTSLFGPLGLLMSGLARTSKFQDMLSNLKGDDLLQDTSTIEFDKPKLDKSVIDLGFRGKKNIINEPVVYDTDISNLVADVSQKDLDLNKTKGSKLLDLDTFKSITENKTLTQEELDGIRDGTIKAPTGIYAKA